MRPAKPAWPAALPDRRQKNISAMLHHYVFLQSHYYGQHQQRGCDLQEKNAFWHEHFGRELCLPVSVAAPDCSHAGSSQSRAHRPHDHQG